MTPYNHQIEVLDVLKNNTIGKVILPTGTGKTWIQALDLANRITDKNEFGVYVVTSPRIMLSYQLLSENKKLCIPVVLMPDICVYTQVVSPKIVKTWKS